MLFDKNSNSLPRRNELPPIPGAPEGAAWFWGADDELGRLNLLTPTRVKEAIKEVSSGEVVPLNAGLAGLNPPCFHRDEFKHTIKALPGIKGHCLDDFHTLNTQSSTQWDGFRHFAHPSGVFYNNTTLADILGPTSNTKCGMQAWARHGIVARGILLDFASYAAANNISVDCYNNTKISFSALVEVGKAQGIDIRPAAQGGDVNVGDIVLVRTGFVKNYGSITEEERRKKHGGAVKYGPEDEQRYVGMEQSEEMLDWLHDCYFSGVAGDNPSLEAWPSEADFLLHDHLLPLWGCPVGELWDLERLAERCGARGKWTFLLTSAVANVEGGVASSANAIAIL